MPNSNGFGISKWTARKHELFSLVLEWSIGNQEQYVYPHSPPYLFIDITAGPGRYQESDEEGYEIKDQFYEGSPVLAAKILQTGTSKRYPEVPRWEMLCYEKDPTRIALLRAALEKQTAKIDIRCVDFNDHLLPELNNRLEEYSRGCLFYDPTKNPQFETLWLASQIPHFQRIDIFLYLSATNWKRSIGTNNPSYRALMNVIKRLNKKSWRISEPTAQEEWVMLIGTNHPHYPPNLLDLLADIDSPEGKLRVNRINLSKPEYAKKMKQPAAEPLIDGYFSSLLPEGKHDHSA
jgi:three-Cys-motif partner protein